MSRKREMENFENPTPSAAAANQAKRKNNFSIENILSRPDNNNCQYRESEVKVVKFMRQNPFQNNHVLFNHQIVNNFNNVENRSGFVRKTSNDEEIKLEEDSNLEIADETHSEIASDDGNSNNSNCKEIIMKFLELYIVIRMEP